MLANRYGQKQQKDRLPHFCFPNLMGGHLIDGVYLLQEIQGSQIFRFSDCEVEKGSLK